MQDVKGSEYPERHRDPSIEVSWRRPDVAQIALLGEHDLASSATLERTIDETLNTASHLVIDLTQAEFIDSTTIHTLVRVHRRAELIGTRFNVVVGPATVVRRALEVTDVLGTLNSVESIDDAIQSDRGRHIGSTRMTPMTVRPEGGDRADP